MVTPMLIRTFVVATVVLIGGCKSREFEGRVTMKVSRADTPPSEMSFETSGGQVRIALGNEPGAGLYALVRPDGLAVFVSEADKAWSDLTMDKSRAAVAEANPQGPPTVKRTGKRETVAGQSCELWEIAHTSGKRTEACIAENFIAFDLASLMPGTSPFTATADEARKQKLFPLRAVELDASGKETSRMVVTQIERKSIDKARFEVPKDFTYAKKL